MKIKFLNGDQTPLPSKGMIVFRVHHFREKPPRDSEIIQMLDGILSPTDWFFGKSLVAPTVHFTSEEAFTIAKMMLDG